MVADSASASALAAEMVARRPRSGIDRIVREGAGGASTGAEAHASASLRESGHGDKGRCEGKSESIMGLSGSLSLGKR
jgi:hypothetical protein